MYDIFILLVLKQYQTQFITNNNTTFNNNRRQQHIWLSLQQQHFSIGMLTNITNNILQFNPNSGNNLLNQQRQISDKSCGQQNTVFNQLPSKSIYKSSNNENRSSTQKIKHGKIFKNMLMINTKTKTIKQPKNQGDKSLCINDYSKIGENHAYKHTNIGTNIDGNINMNEDPSLELNNRKKSSILIIDVDHEYHDNSYINENENVNQGSIVVVVGRKTSVFDSQQFNQNKKLERRHQSNYQNMKHVDSVFINTEKILLPVKQYSNKFLRDKKLRASQKSNIGNIMPKKSLLCMRRQIKKQKNRGFSKSKDQFTQILKTQASQMIQRDCSMGRNLSSYQKFNNSTTFSQTPQPHTRTYNACNNNIINNNNNTSFTTAQSTTAYNKSNAISSSFTQKQQQPQRMSTSRALQIFSKVYRNQGIERMRVRKQVIVNKTTDVQVKQVVLQQKNTGGMTVGGSDRKYGGRIIDGQQSNNGSGNIANGKKEGVRSYINGNAGDSSATKKKKNNKHKENENERKKQSYEDDDNFQLVGW